MATATLYRPYARNEHGDPVNAHGEVVRVSDSENIGTLTVILGGPSWKPANARGDVVNTTGTVGVSVTEPLQPRHGDLLVVDGTRYAVKGPPQWSHPGVLTGTPRKYNWWTITATS